MISLTTRKRIFTIMTEVFQNASSHGMGRTAMRVRNEGDHCVISTSNRVLKADKEKIAGRILEINHNDCNELKIKYLHAIKLPATSNSRGLGLLTVRRKSGYPLEFNFTEIDTLHTHFFLRVRVQLR